MNSEEREQLVEIVKQSNEVILGEVPFHDTDSTIVTPELNLNEIVVAHVKSQCPECGKYLANVNEHMKLVHLKIRYVFSVTFQYSKQLFSIENNFRNHPCPSCDYRACFKNDLDKHMRSVHGIKNEPAAVFIALKTEGVEPFEELVKTSFPHDHKSRQCPYCNKRLANTKEHIKAVHFKEKNYFCQQCDYKTLFKSDLLKHDLLVHRKIKKSCPECGKQVANLHEHIRLGT